MHVSERRPLLHSPQNSNFTTQARQSDRTSSIASLLANLHIYDKIFLLVLLILFGSGVGVGFYLLATEGHCRTFVDLWQAHVPSSAMANLTLPVQRVLLLPTNDTHSCKSTRHCAKILQEIQSNHMLELNQPDIMYNFVVSQDGSIFEGRGWSFQSSFSRASLAIAFLGDENATEKQVESTKRFLGKAVQAGHLKSCVDVWSDEEVFGQIAEDIEEKVSKCEVG